MLLAAAWVAAGGALALYSVATVVPRLFEALRSAVVVGASLGAAANLILFGADVNASYRGSWAFQLLSAAAISYVWELAALLGAGRTQRAKSEAAHHLLGACGIAASLYLDSGSRLIAALMLDTSTAALARVADGTRLYAMYWFAVRLAYYPAMCLWAAYNCESRAFLALLLVWTAFSTRMHWRLWQVNVRHFL